MSKCNSPFMYSPLTASYHHSLLTTHYSLLTTLCSVLTTAAGCDRRRQDWEASFLIAVGAARIAEAAPIRHLHANKIAGEPNPNRSHISPTSCHNSSPNPRPRPTTLSGQPPDHPGPVGSLQPSCNHTFQSKFSSLFRLTSTLQSDRERRIACEGLPHL